MPAPISEPGRSSDRQEWFATTHWSVALTARAPAPILTLITHRATSFYKAPTLLGVWYRGPFEHNGSCAPLEDGFNPDRTHSDRCPHCTAG